MKSKNVRLSKSVIPTRYKISLTPDLANFTFKGSEIISVLISKPIKSITLHAAELEITSAYIDKLGSKSISYDSHNETATFAFGKVIPKGNHKLKLEFEGILNDKMRGFYRSKYTLLGKERHMAVTQFESTDARRAIPSFDEPDKKAIFDVELVIPNDHVAISNTIETEVLEHEAGYKIIRFAPTPKMSSYLLALIVGKFEHIETKTKEGVLVRVFVTPGKKKQAEFALETAAKTLSFYSDYFKIPYPLPVLDLIAIPDFAAGAMENWGAVTYRETALLYDSELSSTANKQWIALVIAHELAHMWFGNLVTMEWWTHLWLNEGFASYIEYLAVDHLFPKWNIWTQFVYMDHSKALELDGLKSTHPIEIPVYHPREISEIFDAVSYSKGASVIRMLAAYLGPLDFQKGLISYLKKHKYSNAKTEDLWDAFEKVSKKPVGKMMNNWTSKPGYPLISISEGNGSIKLSQQRYFSSPISAKKTKDLTIWQIPVSLVSGSKKTEPFLISKKTFSIPKSSDWIKLNPGETSFARVSYSPFYLEQLSEPILKKYLGVEDRYGIIRDAFALSKSGEVRTGNALRLAQSFKTDVEYVNWAEIVSQTTVIDNLIFREKFYPLYKDYCKDLFSKIVQKVGWEKIKGEDYNITLLRPIVIYALGKSGDKKTIEKAKDLFKKSSRGKLKLDADLRGVVYNLIAENGGEKEYKALRKLYAGAPLQEEKDRILRALCAFKDKKLLTETLDLAFSKSMRAQDQFKAVQFVWVNTKGQEIAWRYVRKNWKKIVERFSGGHLYSRFIQPAAYFTNKKYAGKIEVFFKKNPHEGLERTIAQVTEQILANNDWLSRDRKNIAAYLKNW